MLRTFSTFLVLAGSPSLPAQTVDFNRDVRPLLTKNCTTCHGGVKMAGEVSFLYRDDVLGKGESGETVVVPRDPDASEMIRRLLTSDPDDRMPPPDHHPKPLPKEDVDTLVRWVEQGAKWGDHWSFQKPEKVTPPEVQDKAWPSQELDRFILKRLEDEGMPPAAEADLSEWLRRASLDLTGLPPTLEEVEAFQQAAAVDPEVAMEQAVDRMLASPAYGEKWAAMWLDLARYSDTFGFEKDPHRDIWPWRDWVIDAFNADMPYDTFTIKQLAGDLIENPEPDDLIASAFHRNTQNNTEGGTDDEEWRMSAVIDRVNTTWTAWNATTFGCVQCHAHPYDPIPHDDYYRFQAFFNNSEDVDINGDFPRTKVAKNSDQQAEAVRLEKEILKQRRTINWSVRDIAKNVEQWKVAAFSKAVVEPSTGTLSQQQDDGMVVTAGTTPTRSVFVLETDAEPLSLIRVEIFPAQDDPAEWHGRGQVISGFEASYLSPTGERRPIVLREVAADFLAGPFDPNDSLKKGAAGFGDYPMTKSPRTAWFIAEQVVTPNEGEKLELKIRHGATCNESQNTVLQRFRISLSHDDVLTRHIESPGHREAWNKLQQLESQYNAIPGMTIPFMREREEAATRETRVFIRGNRMTLDKLVEPGIPEVFGGPKESKNRLDMAQWLVSKDNPLAARTLANRLWAQFFGIGIVETLGDFGSSGALPFHPELLDFLALRLQDDHQWHLKPFLKELALSSTYRQSNKATASMIEKDPRNRLLARGPRNRLTAEMVRDQALLVSGLLSTKMGGPPVYPPQPEGIWNSVYSGAKWDTSQGEDRHRRAIYTYNKRTAGYPAFLTFDGSARDVCLPQRVPTNTPLQALVTLNDPAHIEFAQAFAKRMTEAGEDLRMQLSHGYRLITLNDASPEVLEVLASLHADAKADYEQNPSEAAKLAASPGEAALVLVANTLLNSDLALNR